MIRGYTAPFHSFEREKMRTKALVLGALPVPFVGSWVFIDEAELWKCRVEPRDLGLFAGIKARLDVELSSGDVVAMPLSGDLEKFAGRRVRVVVDEEFDPKNPFCVFVDEVRR